MIVGSKGTSWSQEPPSKVARDGGSMPKLVAVLHALATFATATSGPPPSYSLANRGPLDSLSRRVWWSTGRNAQIGLGSWLTMREREREREREEQEIERGRQEERETRGSRGRVTEALVGVNGASAQRKGTGE